MNIIIVHALLLTSVVSATPIPWGVENIPNPMKDPAACGRATVTQSAICDPDRLMKQSSQDAVEEVINNITSVEVAVLLVQHMDLSLYRGDVDRTAQEMAIKIHDTVRHSVVVYVYIQSLCTHIITFLYCSCSGAWVMPAKTMAL